MAVNLATAPDLRGQTLADWLVANIRKDERGCWLWQGEKYKAGYGKFGTGILRLAHRVSWMVHRGPIPGGLLVRHKCDVKGCVNPDHLELGTPLDNSRDAKERGLIKLAGAALVNSQKAECPNGHPLDGRSKTQRYCTQCRRVWVRESQRKIRAARKQQGANQWP